MGNGGSIFSFKRLKDKLYGNKEVRILMCGLDAAGKTTVLYQLKLGEVVTTIPTIGFNVETITYKGINFTTWDVSGRSGIRPLWRHYFQNTDVLIFVVDSNDRDRIPECRDELQRFLAEDELKDCVVLVMANKQDLPNAMSTQELTDKLGLHSVQDRSWYVQGTCATTGDGLYEGLSWLKEELTNQHVKTTVTKPLVETKNSATKSGLISSWFSSLSSYFMPSNTIAGQTQDTS